MKTTSLEILEKSQLPHEQAHAILKAMELEIADTSNRLIEVVATKEDIHAIELKLMASKEDIHALELKVMASKDDIHALALKMEERFHRVEERLGQIDAKIEAQGTRLMLWVFATAIAQTTLLYTILNRKG